MSTARSAPQCPRCAAANAEPMHVGSEDGRPLWTVWHCAACAYTWRDSEPAESIDPRKRPAWAQLQGVDLNSLRQVIPPAGK